MNNPLVSVIINCHNGEKFLKQCLQSVLDQTYKKFEIIFWDNNSKDYTKEIIKKFKDKRIRYYKSNRTLQLGEARNNAINKCKGQLITFLDVDDWYSPFKLELQVKEFLMDKNIGVVFSDYYSFYNYKKKKIKINCSVHKNCNTQNLLDNYRIGILTVMINKKKLKKIKFDVNYNFIEDFDLLLKLSFFAKFKYIDVATAFYRIHGNNLSINKIQNYLIELKKWKKNFYLKHKKSFNFKKIESRIIQMEIKKNILIGEKFNAIKKIFFYDFEKDYFKKIRYFFAILIPNFILKKILI